MYYFKSYLDKILPGTYSVEPLERKMQEHLPLYISESYRLYEVEMFGVKIILAEVKDEGVFGIQQYAKHIDMMNKIFGCEVVLVMHDTPSYNRIRMMEKNIPFIIPNKQMFMPGLMDLRERNQNVHKPRFTESLLPSAQFLLIYQLLHSRDNHTLEHRLLKEIAKETNYTPMAISHAVENLKQLGLITVHGIKEKMIEFNWNGKRLWEELQHRNLLFTPVYKIMYVDALPANLKLLHANTSALPVYSNMNPSRKEYYAMEKNAFYALLRENLFRYPNEQDGEIGIELWKYNPKNFNINHPNYTNTVDPISLYLSMRSNKDERIEMALEQIQHDFIYNNIW